MTSRRDAVTAGVTRGEALAPPTVPLRRVARRLQCQPAMKRETISQTTTGRVIREHGRDFATGRPVVREVRELLRADGSVCGFEVLRVTFASRF